MSTENNVAKLEELLERVKSNRLRLASVREEARRVASEVPIEPEPVPPRASEPPLQETEPFATSEPFSQVPRPEVVEAPPEPAPDAIETMPAMELEALPEPQPEPEPQLEIVAEPEPEPEPDLEPELEPELAEPKEAEEVEAEAAPITPETQTFEASTAASGPVVSVEGAIPSRSWTLDAVLRRAHKLGE